MEKWPKPQVKPSTKKYKKKKKRKRKAYNKYLHTQEKTVEIKSPVSPSQNYKEEPILEIDIGHEVADVVLEFKNYQGYIHVITKGKSKLIKYTIEVKDGQVRNSKRFGLSIGLTDDDCLKKVASHENKVAILT